MNSTPNPDDLEQLIGRALREQPLRKAPATLSARVMAELARQAALPWWRKSFGHWPLAARIGFIVISLALVKVALTLTTQAATSTGGAVTPAAAPISWLDHLLATAAVTQQLLAAIVRSIPPLYLYGMGSLIVFLYAAVFGAGAMAYRTLHLSR